MNHSERVVRGVLLFSTPAICGFSVMIFWAGFWLSQIWSFVSTRYTRVCGALSPLFYPLLALVVLVAFWLSLAVAFTVGKLPKFLQTLGDFIFVAMLRCW